VAMRFFPLGSGGVFRSTRLIWGKKGMRTIVSRRDLNPAWFGSTSPVPPPEGRFIYSATLCPQFPLFCGKQRRFFFPKI